MSSLLKVKKEEKNLNKK